VVEFMEEKVEEFTTIEDATDIDIDGLSEPQKGIRASYTKIKEIARDAGDPDFVEIDKIRLVKACCVGDVSTEYVSSKVKRLYEEKGR
jgi:hypothetical protein